VVDASPVKVNQLIIRDGEYGFLAATENEGLKKLVLLVKNDDLRRKLSQKARETVEDRYSLKLWGPKVAPLYKGRQ
jgi:glycosyltransferase involved in cell wall biosynthesis